MVVKFNHLLPAMPELGMGLPNAYGRPTPSPYQTTTPSTSHPNSSAALDGTFRPRSLVRAGDLVFGNIKLFLAARRRLAVGRGTEGPPTFCKGKGYQPSGPREMWMAPTSLGNVDGPNFPFCPFTMDGSSPKSRKVTLSLCIAGSSPDADVKYVALRTLGFIRRVQKTFASGRTRTIRSSP